MFGVAVASSSPAVAARCAYAEAHVGAVASQNVTDPSLGPRALALMAGGASAVEAIADHQGDPPAHRRTASCSRRRRRAAAPSTPAPRRSGIWAEARALDVACGGNLLADRRRAAGDGRRLPGRPSGQLGDRLIAVMRAARDAGGEAGPVHSAGLKLVREVAWPVADLRVDWTDDDPVERLAALWALYKPQLEAYVTARPRPDRGPELRRARRPVTRAGAALPVARSGLD